MASISRGTAPKTELDDAIEAHELDNERPAPADQRLGRMLVAEGIVTESQVAEAVTRKTLQGGFLGQHLVDLGYLDQETLTHFLVRQCHIPHIKLLDYQVDPEAADVLPVDLCREHGVIAIDRLGSMLTIAMINPMRDDSLAAVQAAQPRLRVKPILCDAPDFDKVFERVYGKKRDDAASAPHAQRTQSETRPAPRVQPSPTKTLESNSESAPPRERLSVMTGLDPEMTWESFVFGDSANETKGDCGLFLADPLAFSGRCLIVGPSGSGKSHLANAMAQRLAKTMPNGHTLRVSAAQWAAALAEDNRADEPALIVVDDVGGHLDSREQQTLAEWLDRTKSIVILAGNESILDGESLEPGFRSRATAALIVHVSAPDPATARILLQRQSAAMGLNLDDELLGLVAERVRDARTLNSVLIRMAAESRIRGTAPSRSGVERIVMQYTADRA